MKWASLLSEAINQSAMETNNYIIEAITESMTKTIITGDMKAVFGRTLAKEQKLGIYLRLDHKLPDEFIAIPGKRILINYVSGACQIHPI